MYVTCKSIGCCKIFIISVLICLWLIPMISEASVVNHQWSDYEVVSSSPQFSLFSRTAAAVDSSGYLHILYAEPAVMDYKELYHQWYDGSEWHVEVIDETTYGQGLFSLDIDSTDMLHICYIDNQDQVKYIWGTPGAWFYATVDQDSSHPRSNPMLTIDNTDKVHICYMADEDTVRYSSNATGTWQSSTAVYEATGDLTPYRLLCNSSNQPIICYQISNQHKYAEYNIGLWAISNSVTSMRYAGDAAVDSSDHLHLCFYNDDANLCYATNAEGSWSEEVVCAGLPYNSDDEAPAIIADSTGIINIFYREHDGSGAGPLNRTYGQSGAWATEMLASMYTEMVAAPVQNLAGQCELLTYHHMLHGIEYFKKVGVDWTRDVIAQAVTIDGPTTIAMDPNENVQIFHYDFLTKSLLATSFDHLTQSTETSALLSEGGIPNSHVCAATVDPVGNRHILLTGQGYDSLNYWTDAGGQWQSSNVCLDNSTGYSLALAPSGDVYAAYYDVVLEEESGSYDPSSGGFWGGIDIDAIIDGLIELSGSIWGEMFNIQYDIANQLHIGSLTGSSWQTQVTVPTASWAGNAISDIGVDALGKVHCIYIGNESNLSYLTDVTGSWESQVIDPNVSGMRDFISMDIDSSGCPHVVYVYDNELKYAFKQGGAWSYETLTNKTNKWVISCTIKIDASDNICICYYDAVDQAVMVAMGGIGAWSHETIVDDCGDFGGWSALFPPELNPFPFSGGYPSMALDSAGKVHISYYKAEEVDGYYNVDGSIHYVTNAFEKPGISVNRESIYWMVEKDSTAQATVTVTSIGLGPLTIFDVDVTGADASRFSVSSDYTMPLEPGQECVITIDFDTTLEGIYEATLNIESNDPAISMVNIPMTVRCYIPPTSSLYCKITSYDFESVVKGTSSDDLSVRVTNNGTTSLNLQSIALDDDTNYVCEDIKFPVPLAPGESYITWVRFTPQSTGRFDAVLYLAASGPPSANTSLQLTGLGIPAPKPDISVSPYSYNFENVQYSAGFAATIFSIYNYGDSSLVVYELAVMDNINYTVDPNVGKWPIGTDLPVTILPKQAVSFGLIFHPTAIGQFDTTVKIFSNDPDMDEYKLYMPLTGQGVHWNRCDFEPDGDVDFADFVILALDWMSKPGEYHGDVVPEEPDGVVNMLDLEYFANQWLLTY